MNSNKRKKQVNPPNGSGQTNDDSKRKKSSGQRISALSVFVCCTRCNVEKLRSSFDDEELQKGENYHKCRKCVEILAGRKKKKAEDTAMFGVEQVRMDTFEVPGTEPVWKYDRNDRDEKVSKDYYTPKFSYGNLDLETLLRIGKYDLVFFYTNDGDRHHNRTTRGTLTFSPGDDEDSLKAVLSVDKSVRVDLYHHHEDVEMKVKKSGSSSISLDVTNCENLKNCMWEVIGGEMKGILNKRQAVRFTPENIDSWNYPIGKEYAKSISFDNNEQAEEIMKKYQTGERLLWLEHHMNVPEDVSRTIQKYLSEKPPPVFFFEEGDIHLEIEWDTEDYSYFFVARPQKKVESEG